MTSLNTNYATVKIKSKKKRKTVSGSKTFMSEGERMRVDQSHDLVVVPVGPFCTNLARVRELR